MYNVLSGSGADSDGGRGGDSDGRVTSGVARSLITENRDEVSWRHEAEGDIAGRLYGKGAPGGRDVFYGPAVVIRTAEGGVTTPDWQRGVED